MCEMIQIELIYCNKFMYLILKTDFQVEKDIIVDTFTFKLKEKKLTTSDSTIIFMFLNNCNNK